jgi:hypothetical protein
MQKKSVVAVLAVVGALLLSSVPLFAQGANAGPNTAIDTDIKLLREDVRSERNQFVAANLPLTDARVALIKEYVQS